MLKKMDGGEEPYMIPGGLMESFQVSLEAEKTQLFEMRKETEDDHQRKKVEIEAMKKDIHSQQAHLESRIQSILKKLPVEVLQNLQDE
ncbi:hypothetical protein HanPI659440_Chr12g0455201 [Helianthus annuus]|nr:hypothetical protein HanPI659440_Chr12g0455201 [Helianthus annuus]